jgi:hypothetical protein
MNAKVADVLFSDDATFSAVAAKAAGTYGKSTAPLNASLKQSSLSAN